MSSSGSLYVATSSEHSSQSQAHNELFERDSGSLIQAQSANNDRVSIPQLCLCQSPKCLLFSVHVSDSAAFSTGSGCSVLGLAVEVNVHVSAFSLAKQSHS